jgi:DNA-binding GntR family transcriptional regulator
MNTPKLNDVRRRTPGEVDNKDQVYSDIKSDIICCALKPGSAVSEAMLVARYNVGKASVRNALSRLGQEKLVISQPRKSHVIAPITIQDVVDLFGVRLALEPVAARLAAGRVDEALLRESAKACEISFDENNRENISRFLRANSEFHRTIADASGNRRMAEQISDLMDETERVRHILIMSTDSKKETISEHGSLVHALVSGDGKKAEQLARKHIERGWGMALSSLLSQFRFMDLNIEGPQDEQTARNLIDAGFSDYLRETNTQIMEFTRGPDGG